MRLLITLLRAAAFLVLLALAVKNDGMVTVRAFFDTSWQLPLLLVMLLMFAAGLLAGILTMLLKTETLRRENHRLRKLLPAKPPSTPVSISTEDTTD